MKTRESMIAELREQLAGRAELSEQLELRAARARDTWPRAFKWSDSERAAHLPSCVVRAQDAEAIAMVLRIASLYGCPVMPYGAGSSVTGAAVADLGSIVLDTRGLDQILSFSPEDGLVRVGAGILGGELESWLNERGYTLGHYPQSLHISTAGGWVSTRSTGTFSAKYGGIEHLVAGLEVVTPAGRTLDFRPVPRSAGGPQLMGVFVGAEGAYGVITRVDLRVFALPQARLYRSYSFEDIGPAHAPVHQCFDRHMPPAVLRLYDATEAEHLYAKAGVQGEGALLIVVHEGDASCTRAQEAAFESLVLAQGGHDLGEGVARSWERSRFHAEWFERGNAGAHQIADSIEVAVAWSQLKPLYDEVMAELRPLVTEAMAHWSHFYTTGAGVYFIFTLEGECREELLERYEQAWRIVMECTLAREGAITHHHGVGRGRREYLEADVGGGAHWLMAQVKHVLDPRATLVPGQIGLHRD